MYQYSNKLSVFVNQSKTEVILRFMQNTPQIPDSQDDEIITIQQPTIQSEPIANIVVTGEFAKEIAALILSTMND